MRRRSGCVVMIVALNSGKNLLGIMQNDDALVEESKISGEDAVLKF